MLGSKLYVFGGRAGVEMGESELGDLWAFDADGGSWEELRAPNVPSARSFHAATSANGRLYVFGGCGADGKRMDWQQRPELCRGSVEYAAPAEYMVRRPMAPALIFCVDVSLAAVQSGATTSAVEAIARTLDAVPEQTRTLVGICTYDSVIHFYHIHEGMAQPRMLVVPDADEPYSPLPAGMAVPLAANREAIDAVLKHKREIFEAVLGGGDDSTASLSMNAQEIFGLFALKARTGKRTKKIAPKVEKQPKSDAA